MAHLQMIFPLKPPFIINGFYIGMLNNQMVYPARVHVFCGINGSIAVRTINNLLNRRYEIQLHLMARDLVSSFHIIMYDHITSYLT